MGDVTTIQLERGVVDALKRAKEYPRQTYNELIFRMLELFCNARARNQYDEFLHKIQQTKMQELWDDEWDETWNRD